MMLKTKRIALTQTDGVAMLLTDGVSMFPDCRIHVYNMYERHVHVSVHVSYVMLTRAAVQQVNISIGCR